MKTGITLPFLLCFILIQYGCENIEPHSELKDDTSVPNIVNISTDSKFKFHQDTLYFDQKKYDGYVFKEFQKGDTALFIGYLNGLEYIIGVKKQEFIKATMKMGSLNLNIILFKENIMA